MNLIKSLMIGTVAASTLCFLAACGAKQEAVSSRKTSSPAAETGSDASAVVKQIYDDALKGNCSEIPKNLTDEFRKAVGSSPDALEALCDTFTDSKKITSVAVKSEEISGNSGKVKVALTHRDGKIEEKDEIVKKLEGKWVMDS